MTTTSPAARAGGADPQAAVIAFLTDPATHGGQPVERIDTHGAVVVLAGERALKLKRAVAFDYMDFSTPARRRAACEAEVRINRRTAPSVYRGVVAITAEGGGRFAFDGPGEAIDWCVDMVRFDQDGLLDRLAARGALTTELAATLAGVVAGFHAAAEPRPEHGGAANLRWVIAGNAQGFAEQGRGILPPDACAALTAAATAAVERQAARLDRRRDTGLVRQCHGDLHLRNIVRLDGRPTPFDAVEFNDAIACIDVGYDLAFLLMDLWRRELRPQANVLLGEYTARTGDVDGLALLPLFLSCRAAVRAKTSATSARVQPEGPARAELEALARRYLAMAGAFLRPVPARLIAIGGRSGSGKSTLARALAADIGPAPGALVLRSDVIRKERVQAAPTDRLASDSYTAAASAHVYQALVERAGAVLATGHAVIADATFLSPDDRAAIEAAARAAGVAFHGVWLEAPSDVLTARVDARVADASDADAAVVRGQLRRDTGPVSWARLDGARTPAAVLDEARQRLAAADGAAPGR